MSRADYQLLNNYIGILTDGMDNTENETRPHWEDGKEAFTVHKFGEVHRYNLQEEFPIASVRKLFWQSCIDEILWIWQKKSNNIKDLNARIWDQWANKGEHPEQEIGSIGKAYGYQLGKKTITTKNGQKIDQVDSILHDLSENKGSRRILTNIYTFEDLHEMNLYPCAYSTTWQVEKGKLNLILNQRSHDTLSAGAWNVTQYAALLCMFAQVSGLEPGEMVHVVADSHCYDRHIPREFQVILKRCSLIQQRAYRYYLEDILKGENEIAIKHFMEVLELLKAYEYDIDFDKEFEKANATAHDNNTNWFDYLNYVRKTPEMAAAKTLIQKMIDYPEVDRILGFKTPKLKLDPNVTNFYDFVSPRTYTGTDVKVENGEFVRDGKYVNNPNSSFTMENYDPQTEGFEFDSPVPVAE